MTRMVACTTTHWPRLISAGLSLRLGGRALRLYGGPVQGRDLVLRDRWLIHVDLAPKQSPGCGLSVLRRRRTVAEMDSAFQAWMRERVMF